jgi:hypothetical protein
MRLPVSKAGRLLRSGSGVRVPEGASASLRDAAASLANIAGNLRTQLDAIAADELATPKEKRRDSAKAVADAKEAFARVTQKVMHARESVGATVQALRDVQFAYEAKLGAVSVERIKRRGDQIRQQGPDAVMAALHDFEQRRDLDGLLALSLDGDSGPLRVFARVARPQQFEQLERDLPSLREVLRHAETMAQGLDEIAAQDDAFAVEGATGGDLLEQANAKPANDALPATWPGFLL